MTHKFPKHKLILDEGFPPRTYFPHLNHRFDIKHIKSDFKKVGLPDEKVYELAIKLNRIIVTYNSKDFKPLVSQSNQTGVIGISPLMPYNKVDAKLISLLTSSSPKILFGKYTKL